MKSSDGFTIFVFALFNFNPRDSSTHLLVKKQDSEKIILRQKLYKCRSRLPDARVQKHVGPWHSSSHLQGGLPDALVDHLGEPISLTG